MKNLAAVLTFMMIGAAVASAEPVAHCTGTTYDWCRSIGDTTVFLNDPNDLDTVKDGYFYVAGGCQTLLPGVPDKYRKCVLDVNEVTAIVEMSQAEKDIVDAPEVAAEMERAAYATEVGNNSLCDATLEQIGSVIDAKRTAFQTQIDNAKANIQQDIDAAGNAATYRAAMTTINNTYSAGFGLLADDLVTVTKQIGRCLKARSALGGI